MVNCHKCEKKAVVVENKIYYCGLCMFLKLGIKPVLQKGARGGLINNNRKGNYGEKENKNTC